MKYIPEWHELSDVEGELKDLYEYLRKRVAELEHDVSMRQRDNDELSAYIKRRDKEWEERGQWHQFDKGN